MFKIDTRERFHAITMTGPILAANMTAEMEKCLLPLLEKEVKNVVLSLRNIVSVDVAAAESLVKLQQIFYEANASFIICEIHPNAEQQLDESNLLELMNNTPTQSEAWDIVQMEEIEREMMNEEGSEE
ncbi:MAG TPA: STAS domain-containing protein [Flavitalea sp.]|nr:STAS domain-containing protein [Flavitalea sp.]